MTSQKYTLYLGESVSGELYPSPVKDGEVLIGIKVTGLKGFIEFLELHLGLRCEHASESLQLEAYLQALEKGKVGTFYEKSFAVDSYSVAKDLYSKRIELLESGFSFSLQSLPKRFEDLNKAETFFEIKHSLPDRVMNVLKVLEDKSCAILGKIHLLRPLESFAPLYVGLIKKLEAQNVQIEEISQPDNSPVIKKISVKNELEAGLLIQVLQKKLNDSLIYLKRDQDVFDLFGRQMGQASNGAEVSSYSRPLMQLVYLSTEFLWEPLDPRKVIEFFNLPVKPLSSKLCSKLANVLAKTPGFGGKEWNKEIETFFAEETDEEVKKKNRKRLEVFFGKDRKRFPKSGADLEAIAEILSFIASHLRARDFLIESNAVNSLCQLLNLVALRKKTLSKLELEKLLENNLPAISYTEQSKQVGLSKIINQPENSIGSTNRLIWYPFCETGPSIGIFFWNAEENNFLKKNGVLLKLPFEKAKQRIELEKRLFNSVKDEIYLIVPERLDGELTSEHPLIHRFKMESLLTGEILKDSSETVETKLVPSVRTEWKIKNTDKFEKREKESFSSLEKLFYWPWIYMLENHAQLRSEGVLSIGDDFQVRGTFSHLFFEEYFNVYKTPEQMKLNPSNKWFDDNADELINKYGALWRQEGFETLLSLLKTQIKKGLNVLSGHLIENYWTVEGMEKKLEGNIFDTKFSGFMDMALIRGEERCVVDLKYAGERKYRERLQENKDLQLALYSKQNGSTKMVFSYTGYFIISSSHLYSKDPRAFKNPNGKGIANFEASYEELWDRMEKTYYARIDELKKGQIIIRDKVTEDIVAEKNLNADEHLDLEDVKGNDYHDYQVLVGFKGK